MKEIEEAESSEGGYYETYEEWDDELEDYVEYEEWVEEEFEFSEDWDSQFYALNEAMLAECETFVSLPENEFNERMGSQSEKLIPTIKPIVTGPVASNIYGVIAACQRAMKRAGQTDKAKELHSRVTNSGDYNEALRICMEYVEFRL